jgi:hypothetical protein
MRLRFWSAVMAITPYWAGPLWHIAFSYWDDAHGCGCWREAGLRRWKRSP